PQQAENFPFPHRKRHAPQRLDVAEALHDVLHFNRVHRIPPACLLRSLGSTAVLPNSQSQYLQLISTGICPPLVKRVPENGPDVKERFWAARYNVCTKPTCAGGSARAGRPTGTAYS